MNQNIIRMLQMITITSFGMGVFNTINSVKAKDLNNKLEAIKADKKLLYEKIANLNEEVLKSKFDNKIIKNNLESAQESMKELNNIFEQVKETSVVDQSKFVSEHFNSINEKLNKGNEGICKILDCLNNIDKKSFIPTNNLSDNLKDIVNYLHEVNNYMGSLTFEQNVSLVNISGCIIIGISMFSIVIILLGNKAIDILKLDQHFPKLKKFIELRLKFQKYYLILDFSIITVILIIMVCINILLFIY
jgi:hypothetical protein